MRGVRSWLPNSLRLRLLLTASLVVVLFFLLAIILLDTAFRKTAENAINDQLMAQLYALLSVADLNDRNLLEVSESPAEPRFSVPESGLYAYIFDHQGRLVWKSDSALNVNEIEYRMSKVGEPLFSRWKRPGNSGGFKLDFTVVWELESEAQITYTFLIAESPGRYSRSVSDFRSVLLWWGGVASALLLALLLLLLRWALAPLRRVALEIRQIEGGLQEQITGLYPDEITALTQNINRLIANSQKTLVRYRNSLGNLAHSLKTPLAMMRGMDIHTETRANIAHLVDEQSQRMVDIVEYQLKRATTAGSSSGFTILQCDVWIKKIVSTLKKVYSEKPIRFENNLYDGLSVNMDSADFLEVCGNIADNAAKWCLGIVRIDGTIDDQWVSLSFDDDGSGIPHDMQQKVLSRGVRSDQHMPGQGIGLSVVVEIVESYGGTVDVLSSVLGGARIVVKLPKVSVAPNQ
jgi:two-component system, OmpR family, sensor histidine kinase PhoQ